MGDGPESSRSEDNDEQNDSQHGIEDHRRAAGGVAARTALHVACFEGQGLGDMLLDDCRGAHGVGEARPLRWGAR